MTLPLQERVAWLALEMSQLNTEDMVELKFALCEISDKSRELCKEVGTILYNKREFRPKPKTTKEEVQP